MSHSKQDDGCVGGDSGGGGTCWSANDETTTSREKRMMATRVGEAAICWEKSQPCIDHKSSIVFCSILFSLVLFFAYTQNGHTFLAKIQLITLHQASRYWQIKVWIHFMHGSGIHELSSCLDDLLRFKAEFSQIINNGERSGLIFNGFIHHMAAAASTGISERSFGLQKSVYVLELLLWLLLVRWIYN